jgi:CRP-like cAMP-binding protein
MLFLLGVSKTESTGAQRSSVTNTTQPAFAPLTTSDFAGLFLDAKKEIVPPRSMVIMQGAPIRDILFIDRGIVRLVSKMGNGDRTVLGLRSSGCALGVSAAILKSSSWCAVETVTPTTLTKVPAGEFIRMITEDRQMLRRFSLNLCREIHSMEEQEIQLRSGSVGDRLKCLMREFAESGLSSRSSTVAMKQTEVADLLAITPAHLSRLLKEVASHAPDRETGSGPGESR